MLVLTFQSELPRLAEMENSLAVFCMATYGEGDPTDNAQDFYDWMQETDEDLSGISFAVCVFTVRLLTIDFQSQYHRQMYDL